MMRQNAKTRDLRRGVAAVELAVCMPFVLLLVFGAVEVSSGLHQQHRVRSVVHECAKLAAKKESTMDDLLAKANELIGIDGITQIKIEINVMPRTVNQASVDPPTTTYFVVDETGGGTPGLDEVPRGTVLQVVITTERPPIPGFGFTREFLNLDVVAQCVFVKEI